MAVRPTAPRIVRYTLKGHINRPVANVIDCYVDENIPDAGRTEAVITQAEIVRDAWQDQILAITGNAYIFDGIEYVDLNSEDGVTGFLGPNGDKDDQGQVSAAQLAPNTSLLVTKETASRRGQRRGRMYLVSVPEGEVGDDGTLTTSWRNSCQGTVDAFLEAINTEIIIASTRMVVVHWTRGADGKIDPDVPGEPTDVNSLQVQPLVATQRRRLRK